MEVSDPPAFVATMVKLVAPESEEGVPEIAPVPVLNESPAERLGEIVQAVAGEPEFRGFRVGKTYPTYPVNVVGE